MAFKSLKMNSENKPALIILAAGMGSRYGGLKQLDTFTNEKDTIIDFSLFDAIKAGYGKVVFVIRKDFEKEFIQLFAEKLKGKIKIEYVFQEVEDIPDEFKNSNREKPWGTAHALLCAKNAISESENFTVINADDYYGFEAFSEMANQLGITNPYSLSFSMMGYHLINTISKFGSVSRGECFFDTNNKLVNIVERTKIFEKGNTLFMEVNKELIPIEKNTIVSMNFWGFTPKIFEYLETLFISFLRKNHKEPKAEFFIPSVVNTLLKEKKATVKVLTSNSKWMGVTYPEDKENLMVSLKKLKESKVYPKYLWD